MSDVPWIPFEDLFLIPKRNGLYKPKDSEGTPIKIIKMGELFAYPILDGHYVEETLNLTYSEIERFTVKTCDLIFSRTSLKREGVGKCIIVRDLIDPTVFESNLIRVRLNPEIANPWFYFYFFNSPLGRNIMDGIIQQVGASAIKGSELEKLIIPFPPLEYQKIFSNALKSLDFKILHNKKINQTLELSAQTIFDHWFRNSDFSKNINKNISLEKHIDVIKGVSYRSVDLKESKNALVSLKSIGRGGGFKLRGLKEYVGDFNDNQVVKSGEIVMAYTDLTQEALVIGKPAIVRKIKKYSTLIATLDLCIIRPNKSTYLDNWYLYFLFKTKDFQNHVHEYVNGTTVLHLDKHVTSDYKFNLPSESNIAKFNKIALMIFEKIWNNDEASSTMFLLRDKLLSKLMKLC